MPEGQVLEFTGVTKLFGDVAAVSDLNARIDPGAVTAFLGPNGAGKTTTLRILLGQLRPTSGTATIGGSAYSGLRNPIRTVGAVMEQPVFRPRRTAVKHLMALAKPAGLPASRVDEVLDLVGMSDVATLRIGGFSLGMRQRLSVASALLGDPGVLVFDEPVNGLDPEGIRWMRLLMRRLADEGRTVLISSHLLAEVQQIADAVLILSHGRLVFSGGIEDMADPDAQTVAVDSPQRTALADLLKDHGYDFEVLRSGLNVHRASSTDIGTLAASSGIALSSLHQRGPSLEDVFLQFVNGTRVQGEQATGAAGAGVARQADAGRAEGEEADDQADSSGAADEGSDGAVPAHSPETGPADTPETRPVDAAAEGPLETPETAADAPAQTQPPQDEEGETTGRIPGTGLPGTAGLAALASTLRGHGTDTGEGTEGSSEGDGESGEGAGTDTGAAPTGTAAILDTADTDAQAPTADGAADTATDVATGSAAEIASESAAIDTAADAGIAKADAAGEGDGPMAADSASDSSGDDPATAATGTANTDTASTGTAFGAAADADTTFGTAPHTDTDGAGIGTDIGATAESGAGGAGARSAPGAGPTRPSDGTASADASDASPGPSAGASGRPAGTGAAFGPAAARGFVPGSGASAPPASQTPTDGAQRTDANSYDTPTEPFTYTDLAGGSSATADEPRADAPTGPGAPPDEPDTAADETGATPSVISSVPGPSGTGAESPTSGPTHADGAPAAAPGGPTEPAGTAFSPGAEPTEADTAPDAPAPDTEAPGPGPAGAAPSTASGPADKAFPSVAAPTAAGSPETADAVAPGELPDSEPPLTTAHPAAPDPERTDTFSMFVQQFAPDEPEDDEDVTAGEQPPEEPS